MFSTVRIVLVVRLILVAFMIFPSSCSNNSTPQPPPVPLLPVPLVSTHLYVGVLPLSATGPGQIRQFELPFTSTSTPTVTVSTAFFNGVALDANGNIAAGDRQKHLAVFNAPLSNSSTPAVVFNNGTSGNRGDLVFDAAGDLLAPGVTPEIDRFTPPLTPASAPSQVITDSRLKTVGAVVLDANGDLIACNADLNAFPITSNLVVFKPPYSGASLVIPQACGAMAVSGTQLFTTGPQRVDVYNLPLTANSAPAFSITNGLNIPVSVALDSSGNLYVGHIIQLPESAAASISVYNQPLSASSAPSVTFAVPPIPNTNGGSVTLAVGK